MAKTNKKLLIFLLRKINVDISEHFKTSVCILCDKIVSTGQNTAEK